MTPSPRPLDLFGLPLEGLQLVEASAGTGKTWTLCGLYVRLLLERGLRVREILVVTFTQAATAELEERVRARLVAVQRALAGGPVDPPTRSCPPCSPGSGMRGKHAGASRRRSPSSTRRRSAPSTPSASARWPSCLSPRRAPSS